MAKAQLEISSIAALARQIEADVLRRGLGPGDRYLTAAEAGCLLGVSTTTAGRAMKLLAERRKLVRRRNAGTFVGPGFAPASVTVRTVHVLMPAAVRYTTGVVFDVLLDALRRSIERASIHVSFLPAEQELAFVREVIGPARESGQLTGIVAISCSHDVYRYLSDTGTPMVVFGTLYHDLRHLPSIDLDYHQSGRLLAEHLIQRGHRRLALLTNQLHRPGDDAFLEGVTSAMGEAGLPANALLVRTAAPDLSSVPGQVEQLLALPDAPTAIIARQRALARSVRDTLAKLCGPAGQKIEIVYDDYTQADAEPLDMVRSASKPTFDDIAEVIGDMLRTLIQGRTPDPLHVTIATELAVPVAAS